MAAYIFVSYSRKDQAYARDLASELRKQNFEVWLDEHIDYGERWWRTIVRAIRASAALIVVMTPDSEQSEWVEREILLAQDEQKPIFPLLLRGKVNPLLISKQYANVTQGQMPPRDFYERLGRVLRSAALPGSAPPMRPSAQPAPARTNTRPASSAGALVCPQCGLPFNREIDLQTHMANWHAAALSKKKPRPVVRAGALVCPECGLPFNRETDLQAHVANWH